MPYLRPIFVTILLGYALAVAAQDIAPGVSIGSTIPFTINSSRGFNPLSSIARTANSKSRLGIAYNTPYLVTDLQSALVYSSFNTRIVCPAISISTWGNNTFQVYTPEVSVSKRIEKKLMLGVAFACRYVNQPAPYPDLSFVTASVGASFEPSEAIAISSCIKHISLSKLHVNQEFCAGVSYTLRRFFTNCQVILSPLQKPTIDLEADYEAGKHLCIFARTSTGMEPLGMGAEFSVASVRVEIAMTYHRFMGINPYINCYKQW